MMAMPNRQSVFLAKNIDLIRATTHDMRGQLSVEANSLEALPDRDRLIAQDEMPDEEIILRSR